MARRERRKRREEQRRRGGEVGRERRREYEESAIGVQARGVGEMGGRGAVRRGEEGELRVMKYAGEKVRRQPSATLLAPLA